MPPTNPLPRCCVHVFLAHCTNLDDAWEQTVVVARSSVNWTKVKMHLKCGVKPMPCNCFLHHLRKSVLFIYWQEDKTSLLLVTYLSVTGTVVMCIHCRVYIATLSVNLPSETGCLLVFYCSPHSSSLAANQWRSGPGCDWP